jgi:hypothetical protein
MIQEIFDRLWKIYTDQNPDAARVYDLFTQQGEKVENDHIAFRTFNHPSIGVDKLAKVFLDNGYVELNEYEFPEKKLYAKHYAHPEDASLPKVFISELKLEEFSEDFQQLVIDFVQKVDVAQVNSPDFIYSGVLWGPLSFATYERLAEESEYAAWLYANGFVANHFTVNINALKTMESVEQVNDFLKTSGFTMNGKPNEIQGTPKQFLEQSSIKAGKQDVEFMEGVKNIPACYYEFARRYPMENGELFQGFIAKSADKIFESTDR